MLDQLQMRNTFNPAHSDDHMKHTHVTALTMLSWLQPEPGAKALTALLSSRPAAKVFHHFIARACPRLTPSLQELITQLRGGTKEEVAFFDSQRPQTKAIVPIEATRIDACPTLNGLLNNKELLLGWTEFLASEECRNVMATLLPQADGTHGADRTHPEKASNEPSARTAVAGLKLLQAKKGTTWVSMFTEATRKLPHAVLVADTRVAGLPLISINDAFMQLTGYTHDEVIGQNCRFLQGPATEEASVAELVRSIRERQSCVVKITNYRKDGGMFTNELSLHPVFDSRGVYRYIVGVASDAGESSAPGNRAMLVAFRQLLPTHFPASLNVDEEQLISVEKYAQEEQFVLSMLPSEVQRLVAQGVEGVDRVLSRPQVLLTFWGFLNDAERQQLEELGLTVERIQRHADEDLWHLPPDICNVIHSLERRPFDIFLQTTAGDVAVESLIRTELLSKLRGQARVFLKGYQLPTDAAGWLRAFALLTSPMQSQICLSDVTQPGNPLIYVNRAWCDATGYSREDVLGRNCRILQGPDTESEAVQEMVEALRSARDTCVRVTNYRKNGDTFKNLVALRPVVDSNGVYRFCIGMALALTGAHVPKMPTSMPRLQHAAAELASVRNVVISWVPRPVGKTIRELVVTEAMLHVEKPDEVTCFIREALDKHFLLHVLNDECKDALVAAFQPRNVLQGQYLIKRSSPPDVIYVLCEGLCAVMDGDHTVAILHPGDIFGELAILQGTVRSASVMTHEESQLYVLPKHCYAQILSRHDPQPDLLARSTSYVHKQEHLHETEQSLLKLMLHALQLDGGTVSAAARVRFSANHAEMVEVLEVLKAQQQLSIMYWLNDLSRSLMLCMQNETARSALEDFMLSHGHRKAAHELQLVIEADASDGGAKSAAILNELTPDAPVQTMSKGELQERLLEAMAAVLDQHATGMLSDFFLYSDEFPRLLEMFIETPSLALGLPAIAPQTTWVRMFTEATRKLPHAVLVADTRVAGLPLISINDAFMQLTGYTHDEVIGQNCRFLQGPATEEASVAELVRSIRERQSCVVKITNYRKDGGMFTNELSLHPVFDSRGVYRYIVGVASDAGESSAPGNRAMLVAFRQLLPTHFPASLIERVERRVRSFDVLNEEYQYVEAALQLAHVACCNHKHISMEQLLQSREITELVTPALPMNETRFRYAACATSGLSSCCLVILSSCLTRLACAACVGVESAT